MKVRDPEGRTWRVTRRWLPWRPRPRVVGPGLSLDIADGLIGFVVALAFGLVVLPVLSFVLISGGEVLLLGLLLPFVVIGRIALGNTWWVEARLGYRPYWEEEVGDWRASGQRIRSVAAAIGRGYPPQRTLAVDDDDDETTTELPPTPYDPPREGA